MEFFIIKKMKNDECNFYTPWIRFHFHLQKLIDNRLREGRDKVEMHVLFFLLRFTRLQFWTFHLFWNVLQNRWNSNFSPVYNSIQCCVTYLHARSATIVQSYVKFSLTFVDCEYRCWSTYFLLSFMLSAKYDFGMHCVRHLFIFRHFCGELWENNQIPLRVCDE